MEKTAHNVIIFIASSLKYAFEHYDGDLLGACNSDPRLAITKVFHLQKILLKRRASVLFCCLIGGKRLETPEHRGR